MSFRTPRRLVRGLLADRRGGTAIVIAVIAAIVIAVVSLGTEVVLALDTQRRMQSAADSAALAAATASLATYPDPTQEAFAVAEAFGFTDGRTTTSCTGAGPMVYVGAPSIACGFTSNAGSFGVLIKAPFELHLAKILFPGDLHVHGAAIANVSGGNACTLSLDPSANNAFAVSGGSIVNLQNCGAAVNSNSSSAVQISGTLSTLTCSSDNSISVSGGYQNSGIDACTMNTGSGVFIDPYANTSIPSYNSASCTSISNVSSTLILQPGCYTGPGHSIDVKSGGSLKFCPGVYVFYDANFTVAGTGTAVSLQNTNLLTHPLSYDANLASDCPSGGTGGVAIALTGTSHIGSVTFNSGAIVDMSGLPAASSGLPQDMLFFQDRNAPSTGNDQFTGGVTQSLNGVLYFPNQTVKWAGGAVNTPGCTQIIARLITFTGATTLNNDNCVDQNLGATVSLSG